MIAPVPPDREHTTTKLGRALRAVPEPGGVGPEMITRAESGYYHDYLSPLALPELALVTELGALALAPSRAGTPAKAALIAIREQVINGDFDASKAESDAWARSPEGRETFRAFGLGLAAEPETRR